MARLPQVVNNQGVQTGLKTFRASSFGAGAVAKGAAQAGQGLTNLGNKLMTEQQREEERLQATAERMKNSSDRLAVDRSMLEYRRVMTDHLASEAENMPEFGTGFSASYRDHGYAQLDAHLNTLPPEMKDKAAVVGQRILNGLIDRSIGLQGKRRSADVERLSDERVKAAASSIHNAVDPVQAAEEARLELGEHLDALNLPPEARKVAEKRFGRVIEKSMVERTIKDDPMAAQAALRKVMTNTTATTKGRVGSAQRHMATITEQAELSGIDPKLMLAISSIESNFRNIHNQSGDASQTAAGLFQFTDGAWKTMGVKKSTDPAVQSLVAAKWLKRKANALTSNGFEASTANVYGMHFLGSGGYLSLLNANPNESFLSAYGRVAGARTAFKAMKNNGALIPKGATVGMVLARIQDKVASHERKVKGLVYTEPKFDGPLEIGGFTLNHLQPGDLSGLFEASKKMAYESVAKREEETYQADLAEQGMLNPYNKDDRKVIDKQYSGYAQAVLQDPAAVNWGEVDAVTRKHGYMPTPVAESLLYHLRGADKATQQNIYEAFRTVTQEDGLKGLSLSGVTGEAKKRIEAYNAVRDSYPEMSPTLVVQQVDREFDADFQKRAKKDDKAITKTVARLTTRKVSRALDFDEDSSPFGEQTAQLLAYKVQDRMKYHLGSGYSEDTAKALAIADVKPYLGKSKVSGGGERRMMFPPENFYPADKRTKSRKWINDQLHEHVNLILAQAGAKFNVGRDSVFLRPVKTTVEDVENLKESGGTPNVRYEVWFRRPDGVTDALPLLWSPSVERMRARAEDEPAASVSLSGARKQKAEREEAYNELADMERWLMDSGALNTDE